MDLAALCAHLCSGEEQIVQPCILLDETALDEVVQPLRELVTCALRSTSQLAWWHDWPHHSNAPALRASGSTVVIALRCAHGSCGCLHEPHLGTHGGGLASSVANCDNMLVVGGGERGGRACH